MTTSENTPEKASAENTSVEDAATSGGRPFGFWITAIDRLMAAEFATAFEDEGITRRDWRILNLIDGTTPSDRPLPHAKLGRLVELGWIERDGEGWTLTAEGAAAKARLSAAVDEIRAQITAILGDAQFTALTASLEELARGLGWTEGARLPRRHRDDRRPERGDHRRFGHDVHHGRFGHDVHHGSGHDGSGHDGFGPAHHDHGPHVHHDAHRGHRGFGHHGSGHDGGHDGFGPAHHDHDAHHPGFAHEGLRHEGRHRRREHGESPDGLRPEHRGGRHHGGRGHRGHAPHFHIHLHDGRFRD
ncbi:MarR family winged helix-turn-helix transcriptional regulator [Microbacterium sp. 22242]|uniref:MarR family winged helix-turn-helix transcriptional regulator n=1 Tax=Microbacterium sp. 22242 TaxID=3453896 RepID=UPI003F8244D1